MEMLPKFALAILALFFFASARAELSASYPVRPKPTYLKLAYATVSPSEVLDIYMPEGLGPFPVVVYIHGGAFRYGTKEEPAYDDANDVRVLTSRGIALASINYRMSGEARFPAAVVDAKAAIRWLRANAVRLNLNPEAIAVWGKSAGGNIALMVAMARGDSRFIDTRLGNMDISESVSAVVAMYAPTDFTTMDTQVATNSGCGAAPLHGVASSPESLYLGESVQSSPQLARAASPISYVSLATTPTLLQTGTADCTVPQQQSQELYEALLPVLGVKRTRLMIFQGAGHADKVFDRISNIEVVSQFMQENWG